MKKIIIFKHDRGYNDILEEEFEFNADATDDEITEEYTQWMIEQITDSCTWYEKVKQDEEKNRKQS